MIDDDAWLGFGAIVLDGVRIGGTVVVQVPSSPTMSQMVRSLLERLPVL